MKKNIWIMNHYASSMFFNQGGRHYNFAKYLKQAGYAPVVFCANSKHGSSGYHFETAALWHEHRAEEIDTPFLFVKARTYADSGKQRVLNMIDFYRNVKKTAKEYAAEHGKPDIIFASSVHPLTLVAGIQLAKWFGVECICEVRDLWPESIVAYSTRFTSNNPLIRLLYQGEKYIYKKADALVFTMEGAYDYIVDRGWENEIPRSKVFCINNGVNLEKFYDDRECFRIQDADLDDPETIKIVYAGSIRKVNNLGVLLDAAKEVEEPRIRFLIWGDGNELPSLRQRLADENITNVVFKGRVEKKYVPHIVSRADWNYIHGDSLPLFRFGISANKMFDYFAAAKPVLMDMEAAYNPVDRFSCGLISKNPGELIENIKKTMAISAEDYGRMCQNSSAAAQEYNFENLTKKLIRVIEEES